jgi:hypothetical protein
MIRHLVRATVFVLVMILTVIAVAAPTFVATGANRDAEGEHEPVAYWGTTACGVERWFVKVRRVGACIDCLREARSSR